MVDPEQWVEEYGDALYRYALKHVRNPEVAVDLVQDALLAAWSGRDQFDGRSQERTWLIGILRHKVLDYFRRRDRERPAGDPAIFEERLDDNSERWQPDGQWRTPPLDWGAEQHTAMERDEFWRHFEICLDTLPERTAQVFMLREFDDVDTDEVCEIFGISSTNLYVLMYRARMQLRDCLERSWLATEEARR